MSCLLLYGPGAREEAVREAGIRGRLLVDPLGDDGLKVDDARLAVEYLSSAPVGSDVGIVIIGPMDLATPKASDVLLKSIEEFDSELVQPILWARDLGGVTSTVRSRCLAKWVNGVEVEDEEMMSKVYDLLSSWSSGDVFKVPALVGEFKGREADLLGWLAKLIVMDMSEANLRLWEHLRPVTRHHNPTQIEIVASFLEAQR